jgi:hypothetical protein
MRVRPGGSPACDRLESLLCRFEHRFVDIERRLITQPIDERLVRLTPHPTVDLTGDAEIEHRSAPSPFTFGDIVNGGFERSARLSDFGQALFGKWQGCSFERKNGVQALHILEQFSG